MDGRTDRWTDGRTADGRVEVIIMLSQLSDVVVVEAGAELGKMGNNGKKFPFVAKKFFFLRP